MESKRKSIIFFCILGIITSYFIINLYLNNKNKLNLENKDSKLISIKLQDKNGDYIDSEIDAWPTEGYIFNKELSTCENNGKVSYENGQIVLNTNGSEKCKIYFDIDNIGNRCKGKEFASCIKENYEIDGAIIYHNLEDATKKEFPNYDLVANDDSYRYAGSNDIVNNYVCFGADKCSDTENYDNLYRIIGIFDDNKNNQYKLKLIKADYITAEEGGVSEAYFNTFDQNEDRAKSYRGKLPLSKIGGYYWAGKDIRYNTWSGSFLNTENLNIIFYNKIPEKYRIMIENHIWTVSGNTSRDFVYETNALKVYNIELGENKIKSGESGCYDGVTPRVCTEKDLTYQDEIGLMYVSDYYYTMDSKYWHLSGFGGDDYYSYHNLDNWLYMGITEWTITRVSDIYINALMIATAGYPYYNMYINVAVDGVRPTFYLNSDVKLVSGNGTISNPYKLSM